MVSAHDKVIDGGRGPRAAAFRDAWDAARNDAILAYRCWCQVAVGAKRDAYAVYLAAADREAAAMEALVAGSPAEHVARPH